MIKIKKIINSIYNSNTYILYTQNSKDVYIIDVGDVDKIIEWLEKSNYRVKSIFLTHTHYDHIYGLNDLLKYCSNLDVFTSYNGKRSLYSDKYNLSRYHDENFIYKGTDVNILKEKDQVELWDGINLLVYETPGHDWSCLTYQVNKYLFTGDSYIPGTKVVSNFPKSSKSKAIHSLEILLDLENLNKLIVLPGHN